MFDNLCVTNKVNYTKIYSNLIRKRTNNPLPSGEYGEKHHILPRCLGGKNTKENIIKLSAREHFIAHLLLCKIHQDQPTSYLKMLKAFMMMLVCKSDAQNRHISSRRYERLRHEMSEIMSKKSFGAQNSQFGKKWIHNPITGEVVKINKIDEMPKNWADGRVPKVYKKGKFATEKEHAFMRKRGFKKRKSNIYFKVKYCKYFLEFAAGTYQSIIKFTTSKKISKTNEPLNRAWKILFPEIAPYKDSTRGFSSLDARTFLKNFNITNLKELYHFTLGAKHKGCAVGLHPKG